MATKPVKWFHNGLTGVPQISGTAGSLISLLDAVLVNGFNLITLDSLVVSGNVLTGTKAGHGFVVDQVVLTSANEASLQGEWTITSVTSNTFVATATGVSNVTGTGTLTAKAAPLGWAKVFAGTNKAVYQSNDPTSTKMYLRVDDTNALYARVRGFETMSDVDNGTGPFPTDVQISGGGYWGRSDTANSTACRFYVIGDSKGFYYLARHNAAGSADNFTNIDYFGDYDSVKAGDVYNCLLTTPASSTGATSNGSCAFALNNNTGQNPGYSPRAYTQLGSSVVMITYRNGMATSVLNSGGTSHVATYPSPVSNGLIIAPVAIVESANAVCRGLSSPGIYAINQNASAIQHLDTFSNVSGVPGGKLQAVVGNDIRMLFNLYGPWR